LETWNIMLNDVNEMPELQVS